MSVTDFHDALPDEPRKKRVWIPRETWRQEKAVVWVRECVAHPHKFMGHDRAEAKGDKSHFWQWKRGIRPDIADTQLAIPGRHLWWEFKAPGKRVEEGDGQDRFLAGQRELGDAAAWGVTIYQMFL